jgi:hypothetical protein
MRADALYNSEMPSATINQKLPSVESPRFDELCGVQRSAASPLAVLAEIDPRLALVGEECLIQAYDTGAHMKVAVAIHGNAILVSLGVRAGAYSRQHWQLIQEDGSKLHPEASSWLDPHSHKPNGGVHVLGTAFRVENGTVILGGGSGLYVSPEGEDARHLANFLQRALDSKLAG